MATLEERFAALENRVVELERQRAVQEERDLALLARIDDFIDDLRRIERVQMRSFDVIMTHQKEQYARLTSLEASVAALVETAKEHKRAIEILAEATKEQKQAIEMLINVARDQKEAIDTLTEASKDHKRAIDTLAQGQQQILAILTGEQRLHD